MPQDAPDQCDSVDFGHIDQNRRWNRCTKLTIGSGNRLKTPIGISDLAICHRCCSSFPCIITTTGISGRRPWEFTLICMDRWPNSPLTFQTTHLQLRSANPFHRAEAVCRIHLIDLRGDGVFLGENHMNQSSQLLKRHACGNIRVTFAYVCRMRDPLLSQEIRVVWMKINAIARVADKTLIEVHLNSLNPALLFVKSGHHIH